MADDKTPRPQGPEGGPPAGGNWMKSLLIWAGILLALVLVVQMVNGGSSAARDAMAYSDFIAKVDEGQVKNVQIGKDQIVGQLADNRSFRTNIVPDPSLTTRLREKGVRFDGQPEASTSL